MDKLRTWMIAALAAVVLATTAGCSDDASGDDDAGSSESSEATSDTTDATDETDATDGTDASDGLTLGTEEPTETDGTDETEPTAAPTISDDFCTNVQSMLDSLDGLFGTFEGDDYEAYVAWAESFVEIGQAVVDTAPADQAANVAAAVTPLLDLAEEVAALDPSDTETIDEAFNEAFTQSGKAADRAGNRILDHCGIDPETLEQED